MSEYFYYGITIATLCALAAFIATASRDCTVEYEKSYRECVRSHPPLECEAARTHR